MSERGWLSRVLKRVEADIAAWPKWKRDEIVLVMDRRTGAARCESGNTPLPQWALESPYRSGQHGLPMFRHVDDAGDGCDQYQCLTCKKKWDSRGPVFAYCPYCGMRFVAEYDWRTARPDTLVRHERRADACQRNREIAKERRHTWCAKYKEPWNPCWVSSDDIWAATAAQALKWLRRRQADEAALGADAANDAAQYKLYLVPGKPLPLP